MFQQNLLLRQVLSNLRALQSAFLIAFYSCVAFAEGQVIPDTALTQTNVTPSSTVETWYTLCAGPGELASVVMAAAPPPKPLVEIPYAASINMSTILSREPRFHVNQQEQARCFCYRLRNLSSISTRELLMRGESSLDHGSKLQVSRPSGGVFFQLYLALRACFAIPFYSVKIP